MLMGKGVSGAPERIDEHSLSAQSCASLGGRVQCVQANRGGDLCSKALYPEVASTGNCRISSG